VIATLIARSLVGNAPLYATPDFALTSGWEMLRDAGVGLVGAVASVVFMIGVKWGGLAFKRLGKMKILPRPFQPVVGMALVGVLGLWVPNALVRGYGTINLVLEGKLRIPERLGTAPELTALLLLGIALVKLVATALTRGSGGAGGLFTPSLAFGALVGGAYGYGVHWAFPHLSSPYGA